MTAALAAPPRRPDLGDLPPAPWSPWLRHLAPARALRGGEAPLFGELLLVVSAVAVALTTPLLGLTPAGCWTAGGVVGALVLVSLAATRVPWSRLPDRALLVLPGTVFVLMAALGQVTGGKADAYVGLFVLCFAYTGVFLPPRSGLTLLPVGLLAYPLTTDTLTPALVVRMVIVASVWVLLAELLASFVHRQAETVRLLARATRTDALTSLDNRRGLTARLRDLHDGDSLVLCDLDHFKRVNDTAGHAAGDAVLEAFGTMLAEGLREGDYAARYGGEEFVLVLPATTPEVARRVTVRLQDEWRRRRPDITFSAGVAEGGRTTREVLDDADQALYVAKSSGRDRVVVHSPSPHGADGADSAAEATAVHASA